MSATTNMNKSHVSHLLSQATNTGKSMNKETDEFNDIYTGPQLSPLISVPSIQNMKAAKSASKYTETNVLPTVLKRVGTLESYLEKCKKKLKHALSIIKDRDTEIIKLKEQVRLLQDDQDIKRFSKSPPDSLSEFLQLSESLENRVSAIENFLKGDPFYWYKSNLSGVDPLTNNFEYANETDPNVTFDLDSVLLQINELNFEASEIHICQHTKQGAVFQNCQSVSLTFYANGMQLEGHEFREYSDMRSQNFIKDILDGYFPSELQEEYPRGVIFNVGDRRSVMYEEDDKELNLFRGKGCRLDSSSEDFSSKDRSKRRRFVSIFDHRTQKEQSTSCMSDYQSGTITQVVEASRDHFKRRLPESITKSRINLLSDSGSGEGNSRSIYRMTTGKSLLPDAIIKDGEVCNKKNRKNKSLKKMDIMNDAQIKYLNPETINTDSCVQLKIRSINDKELFVLTMGVNDPVGKLRTYLPDEVRECNIMHYKDSCNRIYLNENNSTLKEYGIVNNSVLVLTKPKVKKCK